MAAVKCATDGCNCKILTEYGHTHCSHCRPRSYDHRGGMKYTRGPNSKQKTKDKANKQHRTRLARGVPDSWNV